MDPKPLIEERSPTLIAAEFAHREAALRAAQSLGGTTAPADVMLISPGDEAAARKLEPEQRNIWRTMLRGHAVLMAAGAVLGLLLALVAAGVWEAAARSPGYTVLFGCVMGLFVGGMAGGLLTLRPDRSWVIRRVRAAQKKGRWAVVVHPRDEQQAKAALRALEAVGAQPMRSL